MEIELGDSRSKLFGVSADGGPCTIDHEVRSHLRA